MDHRHHAVPALLAAALALAFGAAPAAAQSNVYQTYGVHNPPSESPCADPSCVYKRGPDEPTDPL